MTCVDQNNLELLLSLPNIVVNKDKITSKTISYVCDTYFHAVGRNPWDLSKGPVGPWALKIPDRAFYGELSFDIPKNKVDSIIKILDGTGFTNAEKFTRHYKDNGLIFSFDDKITKVEHVVHKRQVIKQPWFDKLLEFMCSCDPSYTEEKLIDSRFDNEGYEWFNSCAVKEIKDPYTEIVKIYDENASRLTICVMNNDVINNKDKINFVIGLIFSII